MPRDPADLITRTIGIWVGDVQEAQDAPNTALMIQFYEELSKPGMSRAKALHLAQRSLFDKYQAANIWATYILVGNWL